jgi:hypothetical protein
MLVACRLAGLCALEAYYAGVRARAQCEADAGTPSRRAQASVQAAEVGSGGTGHPRRPRGRSSVEGRSPSRRRASAERSAGRRHRQPVGHVTGRSGAARRCRVGLAWPGEAWRCGARRGSALQGAARQGKDRGGLGRGPFLLRALLALLLFNCILETLPGGNA